MFPEHPPLGAPHPWTDPLAPQDFFNPRPDTALGTAGALAPSPSDFPLTEEGKRQYYAAVQRTADEMVMQRQHAISSHARIGYEAQVGEAEAARPQAVSLLLVL